MSVYIGPDGNVWSDGKPIDWSEASKFTTAANPSANHKMPTISELHALVKKFQPPPVTIPPFVLVPSADFNPPPEFMAKLQNTLMDYFAGQFALPPMALQPGNYSSGYVSEAYLKTFLENHGVHCPLEPIRRRQLSHDDAHLFQKPETKDRGRQFDEQEILRASGKTRCQYAWSEALQAHVQIGGPLR